MAVLTHDFIWSSQEAGEMHTGREMDFLQENHCLSPALGLRSSFLAAFAARALLFCVLLTEDQPLRKKTYRLYTEKEEHFSKFSLSQTAKNLKGAHGGEELMAVRNWSRRGSHDAT